MSLLTWRSGAMAAGVCAALLAWQNAGLRGRLRDRSRAADATTSSDAGGAVAAVHAARIAGPDDIGAQRDGSGARGPGAQEEVDEPAPPRPHWALELLRMREGEDLFAYRDRVLPIALAVVAPQRARVDRRRLAMAATARLDARQQQELDAAVLAASDQIVNRVWQAVADGELWPRPRPAAGVALAADLLTSAAAADRRFRAALRDDQRAAVDQSGFDFADYLLFSVPWEERFGIAEGAQP